MRALDEAFGGAPQRAARIAWVEGRIAELEDGDCRRALDRYEEARDMLPQAVLYRAWLAGCLTSLGRLDEAEEEATWLLQRYPGAAKIQVVAARLYAARGRTADAVGELEAALDTWSAADPEYRPAREARELLDELRTAG